MTTIRQALTAATLQLQPTSDSAALDAQLLLAHATGKDRAWLYTWPERPLDTEQMHRFTLLCRRRAAGEPVAYLLGSKAFWTFDVKVSPAVLIPRPETELLVELALQHGAGLAGKVADLGTGSGIVAIALAQERPDWQVYATELSTAALELAAVNFGACSANNLHLLAGNWCAPLPGKDFVLIASNPPYIDADDPHLASGDLRFEPQSALVAADHGLADLERIAREATGYLLRGGWLLLEHGWQQGSALRRRLTGLGYTAVRTYQDQGGRDRVTVACNANNAVPAVSFRQGTASVKE